MRNAVILAALMISAPVHAGLFDKPEGLDHQVWDSMTRDQQIDVLAKVQTEPDALAKDSPDAAITIVKTMLKDPDSARFRDVRRRGALDYCGWVNAKNSYGGYSGYSLFFSNAKFTGIVTFTHPVTADKRGAWTLKRSVIGYPER